MMNSFSMPVIFLASQSPRRRELLDQIGVTYEVLDVNVAESVESGEAAENYVLRVAREKAGAGLLQVAAVAKALVLGADTEVVLDGEIFGKPADAIDASRMLRRLSGRSHQVLSAVALVSSAKEAKLISESIVVFAELSDRDIADYVATGECFEKAGAYAIQGRAAKFIRRIEGSYSGVVGLPLYETSCLLAQFEL